ncbi:MAG: zinc-ribbon domain-containing protein [Deltaproteobacteria bacterium]|nr:zinc-ribbon domain-containing protein [Deltaproteobacteria bacterium]
MIVTCEKCGARYKLDDGKVTGRGAKITCPRCKHIFVVFPDVNEADLPPPTAATTVLPKGPTRSAESLDFRKVGIPSWKVKVRIGLVYDFSDIKTLRKYIADGRVTSEDVISHDGATWVTIGDIPDLDAYFVSVYERAEVAQAEKAARASGGGGGQGGFEDEDTPTMIVGMSSLGNDIAAEALKTSQSDPGGRGPSPATPSGEGPFVDPFAALRSKQRDRAQQQRRPGAAAAAAGAAATKANQAEKRSPLPLIGVAVLLALGAGWYFVMGPGANKPPADPATTGQTTTVPADGATATPDGKSDLQKQIDQTLKEVKPNEMVDEPTRTAVRPNDPRTKAGGAGGANTPPPDGGTTSSAPIDHAANCRSFGKQGDWGQAAMACASATAANPGDGALLAWHGMALYNTGKKGDAASKLNAARKAGGMPSEAYKVLGHIARDNGDVAGAKGYYQQYLSSNPSDKAAIEAEISKLDGN